MKTEGAVAFFSAKRWDRRNRADLIESATPCHNALVVWFYRVPSPLPEIAPGKKCWGDKNCQRADSKRSEQNFYGPYLSDWLKIRQNSLKTRETSYESADSA